MEDSWNFSRLTNSQFIQDPGCKPAVEKKNIQPPPSKQFFTKSLAWSQKNQQEFPSCPIDFNPRTYSVTAAVESKYTHSSYGLNRITTTE